MLRTLLLFTVIVISAAFLVTPRPLIKPDWRTPYNKALAANDCAEIERIADLLEFTLFEKENAQIAYENATEGRCRFSNVSPDEHERLKFAIEHARPFPYNARLNLSIESSLLGRTLAYIRRDKPSVHALIKSHEQRMAQIAAFECYNVVGYGYSGTANYALLSYALETPEIPIQQILEISQNERAACARKIFAELEVIASFAQTPEEYALVVRYLFGVSFLVGSAPELAPAMKRLRRQIPDRGYEIAGIIREQVQPIGFQCENWQGHNVLIEAIECVESANDQLFAETDAPAFALFYAMRAKRLGWRDIRDVEQRAAALVSPECKAEIATYEAEHIHNIDAPRYYKPLRFLREDTPSCVSDVTQSTDQDD